MILVMKNRKLYWGLIVLATLLFGVSCNGFDIEIKPEKITGLDMTVVPPASIQTSLTDPFIVESGEEFELYIADSEEGLYYNWILPGALRVVDGQGTSHIRVVADAEGARLPVRSIGLQAERDGVISTIQWFEEAITIPFPPGYED